MFVRLVVSPITGRPKSPYPAAENMLHLHGLKVGYLKLNVSRSWIFLIIEPGHNQQMYFEVLLHSSILVVIPSSGYTAPCILRWSWRYLIAAISMEASSSQHLEVEKKHFALWPLLMSNLRASRNLILAFGSNFGESFHAEASVHPACLRFQARNVQKYSQDSILFSQLHLPRFLCLFPTSSR